jgi:hypothetical protein
MAPRYEFTLRGHLDRAVVPALSDFDRIDESGFVVLSGDLAPGVGLADVLAQFESLGIGLHAVRQLPEALSESTS